VQGLSPVTNADSILQSSVRSIVDGSQTLSKLEKSLRAEWRNSPEKLEQFEREIFQSNQSAEKMIERMRPDLVEAVPAKGGRDAQLTVYDVSQRWADPIHNFKTKVYGEVLGKIFGRDVAHFDFQQFTRKLTVP
jgi:hypothetical protein